MMPAAPGIVAWGAVTGVAMVQSGMGLPAALALSVLSYAGSAQLAVLPLLAVDAPLWVIFATALAVNLRFVIYAVALKRTFEHLPWAQRLWYGYITGDFTFAIFTRHLHEDTTAPNAHAFFRGLASGNYYAWHAGSFVGLFAATWIPTAWGLGLAGTLALLALIVPHTRDRAGVIAVVVAAAISVVAHGLPYKLGLVLAIVCGALAALIVAERQRQRPLPPSGAA